MMGISKLRARFVWAILACLMASPLAAQTVNVTGVASNDVLNFRAGPGKSFPKIGSLPFNATGLRKVTCTPYLNQNHSYPPQVIAQANALPNWCLIKRTNDPLPMGWVNARFLTSGTGGNGGGGLTHAQACAHGPSVLENLADLSNWRLADGRPIRQVTQNISPGWDAGRIWWSAWSDGGRTAAGPQTRLDFVMDFCSCATSPATYNITALRADDRAEVFLDTVNWTDLGPNFRANHPIAFHNKTNLASGQRQFMIRLHNDQTTNDNPTGLSISGVFSADNAYMGQCLP